ncbi:hypothetical protein NW754_007134 [Fusarium falciforme]|nr:hypothetical protein NW754_007134 [Fusarium falciforme]
MQTPVDEPRAPAKGCSIDMIASKIDSCAKARVFAIIAFNLLVFDGQLSKDRTNWACPFGRCKLNFVDQHELMQHVLDCPHFSRDGVFCNCCIKDDRFEEHCRHDRAESIASHGTEKSSSKKRNPMRKFSNIFSRNRTDSRSSSGSSERPNRPERHLKQHRPRNKRAPASSLDLNLTPWVGFTSSRTKKYPPSFLITSELKSSRSEYLTTSWK